MAGGSIRAAAKAAVVGGYRSAASVRRAVLPSSSAPASAADSRQSSTCAVDDWVIPDREVFGPVPTREEAMAATHDLMDAFEMVESHHVPHPDISKALLSPDGPTKVAQDTAIPNFVHSETSHDLKLVHSHSSPDCPTKVAQDTAIPNLVHSKTSQDLVHSETSKNEDNYDNLHVSSEASLHVVRAFSMLNEVPEAQEVVASLASDRNVWNAVLNNEKVMQFYKTKLSESSSVTEDEVDTESVQSSCELLPSTGEAFRDYVERMKALVFEMMTNLSSIMQDLIATSNEGQTKGKLKTLILNTKDDFANPPSTFVLLAIASIMVVLLKRA